MEIEDKIFGPFTFRQFVYLAGGAGLCYVLYKLIGLLFGIIPIVIIAAISLALTFYRPNNKPFIEMVENGFNFLIKDKLYIWKRPKAIDLRNSPPEKVAAVLSAPEPRLTESKLRDLAWSLDVLDLKKESR